jgi:hypothetical protein
MSVREKLDSNKNKVYKKRNIDFFKKINRILNINKTY